MFEAHVFAVNACSDSTFETNLAAAADAVQVNAKQSQPTVNSGTKTVLPAALHLIHTRTLSPLYIWFVEGKRKNLEGVVTPTWWVQVEYRRADGSHGQHRLEIPACHYVDPLLWQQLTELELADLCPLQTRAAPVGC